MIQKDRVSEMKKWARLLKRAREERSHIAGDFIST
jgi:hypothetical protein